MAIGQSARSCTYTHFLPQGIKIELILAPRAAVSEIRVGANDLAIPKLVHELLQQPYYYIPRPTF